MKNKKKKLVFFLVLFLSIGFFGFWAKILASADELVVTEIMYDPDGTDLGHTDWIEIHSPTSSDIEISKSSFGLIDEPELVMGKDGIHHLSCHGINRDLRVEPGEFVILADKPSDFTADYPENTAALFDGTFSLSSNGDTIRISRDRCATFFVELFYDDSWGGDDNGRTLEKIKSDINYSESNWQESYDDGGTPGEASSEKPAPKIYSSKITINEILPNPKGKDDGEEYIEFYNDSDKAEDLSGWKWRDKKGAIHEIKKMTDNLKELLIPSADFLVIDPQKYNINLYNKDDFFELLTPDKKPVSRVSYTGSAKENLSYGFDGVRWRWSRHLTPGAENIFDDEPDFKVDIDDDVYKNFPASFKVSIKNYKKDKTKITWNFGDGHKSYKKETTHKYKEKGKYSGSVKIFNGSEEVVKTFEVEVKKYPEHDVNIISLVPNPEGKDSDFETITLKNNSKKKINLKGWSIATGDKKLVNHPISTKITLKPKGTAEITRNDSKFTLNNKKGRVELRYPNGKVASKVKYDRKTTSAKEGEILEKTKLGWVWKNTSSASGVPPARIATQSVAGGQETSLLAAAPETGENLGKPVVLGVATDLIGGYSERTPRKDFRLILAGLVYVPSFVQAEEHNQSRIKPNLDFVRLFF